MDERMIASMALLTFPIVVAILAFGMIKTIKLICEREVRADRKKIETYVSCNKRLVVDGNGDYLWEFEMSPDEWSVIKFNKIRVSRYKTKAQAREGLDSFVDVNRREVNKNKRGEVAEYLIDNKSEDDVQKIMDELHELNQRNTKTEAHTIKEQH